MNSITHTISGLASSLFLNVGLIYVAQKLDPITKLKPQTMASAISGELSIIPCSFSRETGQ